MSVAEGRILDAASAVLPRAPRSSSAEVAAAAGVGRTAVHRYVATREALLAAPARRSVQRIADAVEGAAIDDGTTRSALGRLVAALLTLADDYHQALSAESVLEVPPAASEWSRLEAEVSRLIERGKASGEFRPDLPTPVVLAGLLWAVGCSVADGRVAARIAPTVLLTLLPGGIAS